ncbi:MAG: hypothetical protein FJ121_11410 [Deltaproteobacteria bacterium]|nr:hypothetical protein [Deltaproteobacteria bacterium]
MADRYWGKLEFPAALIDAEVTEALQEEGVEMDKLDPSESCDDYAWIEDGIFTLEDSEARYGCWEDLENLLRLKGIPFDRESSGYYEFIPERAIFRPGANDTPPRDLVFLLCDGAPIVEVEKIRNLLAQGAEAVTAYLDDHFPHYPPLSDYVKEG